MFQTWAWTALLERLWEAVKLWLSKSEVSALSRVYRSSSLTDATTKSGKVVIRDGLSRSSTHARSMSWTAATSVLELLRYLLKNVVGKDECTAAFLKAFLRHTANLGCCHLVEEGPSSRVCICLSSDGGLCSAGLLPDLFMRCMTTNCSQSEELKDRELLLGSWLQLLSSVMRSLNSQKNQPLAENNGFHRICMKHMQLLIPFLSDLALSPQQPNSGKHSIKAFLRHKLLVKLLLCKPVCSIWA